MDSIEFIIDANDKFDDGRLNYSKQLAHQIRNLVHDAPRSHALLEQLGYRMRWKWTDESEPIAPGSWSATAGPVMTEIESFGPGKPAVATYRAYLGQGPGAHLREPQDFLTWWKRPIVQDLHKETFSRSEIVLAVANKDGGSHVDPILPARLDELKNGGSLGQTFSHDSEGNFGLGIIGNSASTDKPIPSFDSAAGIELVRSSPIPALVRQFSFELLTTVVTHMPHIYERAVASTLA